MRCLHRHLILAACLMLAASMSLAQKPTVLPKIKPTYPDVVFAKVGGKPLKLDLYLPADTSKPVPLIIHIHGGGWSGGDKIDLGTHPYLPEMLKLGFAVTSIQYRLTKDGEKWGGEPVAFPAQIHDVKGAVRFLRANAAKYHLDPKRFGACGESAGGHLTALLATSGGVAELEGKVGGNKGVSSKIQAGVDYCGPTDLVKFADDITTPPGSFFRDPDLPDTYFSQLIGYDKPGQGIADIKKHLKDHAPPYPHLLHLLAMSSPITHIKPGLPPIFIGQGTNDILVPLKQAHRLADALNAAGDRVELSVCNGGTHFLQGEKTDRAAMVFFCDVLKPEAVAQAKTIKFGPKLTMADIFRQATADKARQKKKEN